MALLRKSLILRSAFDRIYLSKFCVNTVLPFSARNITLTCLKCNEFDGVNDSRLDLMLKHIRSTNDPSNVYSFIQNNTKSLSASQILEVLKILFSLQKSGESNISGNEILKSKEFIALCKSLKKKVRELELKDVIEALKILSFFHVPVSSIIMQSLLQIIRCNVNDLTLRQITFLNFVLKDFTDDPLSEALKIALPIVFETTLRYNIDKTNPTLLVDLLSFCSKNKTSSKCSDYIANCLLEIDQLDWKVMDPKRVRSIIWSLCDIKHTTETHAQLFQKSIQLILDNLSFYSYLDLQVLLKLMSRKSKIHPEFYNSQLCDAGAKLLIEKSCTFSESVVILRSFNSMHHINLPLLEYLGAQVSKDPKCLSEANFTVVLTLVDALVTADHKTDDWSSIESAILSNNQILTDDRMAVPWLKLVMDLASLGIFIDRLLNRIFCEKFLNNFLSREYNLIDHLQLLSIYQAVKTLYPTYDGKYPPQDILAKSQAIIGDHVVETPLRSSLEHGLGGESYVLTKCWTKMGHFIDHVIVMRKGGYPVALSLPEGKSYIEDIIHPPDSLVVLLMALPPTSFAVNVHRLRGQKTLEIRTLEALGYSVVPVSLAVWTGLPDHEKIPYLMRAIKTKTESLYDAEQISSLIT